MPIAYDYVTPSKFARVATGAISVPKYGPRYAFIPPQLFAAMFIPHFLRKLSVYMKNIA